MNILVRRTGALGDVVLMTPIVHQLRRVYPDARIHVITAYPAVFFNNPWNIELRIPECGTPCYDVGIDINLNLAYERRPTMHVVDAYSD